MFAEHFHALLRLAARRTEQPTAAIYKELRTLRSIAESGARAGHYGAELRSELFEKLQATRGFVLQPRRGVIYLGNSFQAIAVALLAYTAELLLCCRGVKPSHAAN